MLQIDRKAREEPSEGFCTTDMATEKVFTTPGRFFLVMLGCCVDKES